MSSLSLCPPRLRSAPLTVRFVTNTTKESKRDLLERLTRLGFDIAEHEIFTSLTAARNLLEQQQVRPLLLVDDKALPDFTGEVLGKQLINEEQLMRCCALDRLRTTSLVEPEMWNAAES